MSDMQTTITVLALAGLAASVAIEMLKTRRENRRWKEHMRRLSEEVA